MNKLNLLGVFALIASFSIMSADALLLPKNALKVPLVAQSTNYTCGVASLASVLYYYDILEYGEMDLAKMAHSSSKDGTSPANVAKAAKKVGLNAIVREHLTIKDIQNSLSKKIPVIVDIQAWNEKPVNDWTKIWDDGHYVVAIAVDSQNVYFMDPSFPSYYGFIPHKEFLDRWHDFEEVNGKRIVTQNLGIFIWGKEPRKTLHEEVRKID